MLLLCRIESNGGQIESADHLLLLEPLEPVEQHFLFFGRDSELEDIHGGRLQLHGGEREGDVLAAEEVVPLAGFLHAPVAFQIVDVAAD